VLLITSPNEGDGKTTCAHLLAAALAADGKQVLVVDTDLHKESYTVPLGEENMQLGLREVLSGECSWSEAARVVSTPAGQFYAVGSGGMGPVELLSKPRMTEFLNGARAHCDYVLLDVASFPAFSDALVLGPEADAVLSVIRLRNSSRKLAIEHVRGMSSVTPAHALLINDVGFSERTPEPKRRAVDANRELSFNRWGRRSMWWASALILVAAGAAALLPRGSIGGFALHAASALRR
jgi:Mrp family chromosome partitioning ATPase